ncbi:hypothetical protein [uncultured Thiodictyon sp.]|uniref:hypothetical protein n=1 Tax=uncultured Thiodictyon sp. TaxID=1846217 RepID=UPI0025CE32BC|nr:hypothetical protein [uncultured Thiodictyon sp.]
MTPNQPRERCDRSADGAVLGRIVLAGLCALSLLCGCAAPRPDRVGAFPGPTGPSAPATPHGKTQPPDLTVPPASQWDGQPSAGAAPAGPEGPAFTPFSANLPDLRREVALICGSARMGKRGDGLAPLVTDLYRSGVDPALATEALIQGDCGSVSAVVTELVAQGGSEVADQVQQRALSLSGSRAADTIRAAAAAGLVKATPSPPPPTYGMAYFPSGAAQSGVVTATTPGALYGHATPGYGVYTFVLLGAGFDPAKEADRARYGELLRVIETYVLAGEQGAHTPRAEAHSFLIATYSDRATAPDLSAAMRADLGQYLKRHDRSALAERLTTRPGPFLISSLEPRLLPRTAAAPRLVADLSDIGTGYLYAVVDAYDRPIPPEQQGRSEALAAIRDRLLGLFSRPVPAADLSPALPDAWVFRVGGPPPVVAAPAAMPEAPMAEPGAPVAKPELPTATPEATPAATPATPADPFAPAPATPDSNPSAR